MVIFKGVTASVPGSPDAPRRRTHGVALADLESYDAGRVRDGISADNLADARRIVADLQARLPRADHRAHHHARTHGDAEEDAQDGRRRRATPTAPAPAPTATPAPTTDAGVDAARPCAPAGPSATPVRHSGGDP